MFFHIFIGITGLTLLWGEYKKSLVLRYVFKPLTILLILLIPVLDSHFHYKINYQSFIILGLALSMLGDICLMFNNRYFIPGLFAFLLAHLAYIAAFNWVGGINISWIVFIFLITGILVFKLFYRRLGKHRMPVAVYILVILLMTWQGWELYLESSLIGFGLAAFGSLFFVVSDFVLAVNKFLKPI